MKPRSLSAFFTTVVCGGLLAITACSTPPAPSAVKYDSSPYPAADLTLLKRLKNDLPGYYSNFTQVVERGEPEDNTTDLTIREMFAGGVPVFLFETHLRGSRLTDYDLYWPQHNPQGQRLEFQFSRISGSELSGTEAESLDIGLRRALPGCAIDWQLSDAHLKGQTQLDKCSFESPAHGQLRLYRSIDLSANRLDLADLELIPGEALPDHMPVFQFHKQQVFEGTVSIGLNTTDATEKWQTSTKFNLYDDGRISQLYDSGMSHMQYALKLSRLHWRENEPAYLKLEVIELQSEETQAYSWFNPDSDQIKFDLDWVKVDLHKISLQNNP